MARKELLKGMKMPGPAKDPMLELSPEDTGEESAPEMGSKEEGGEESPEPASDLESFSDDELLQEVKRRGLEPGKEPAPAEEAPPEE